jgi:hypothetical protein
MTEFRHALDHIAAWVPSVAEVGLLILFGWTLMLLFFRERSGR